MASEVMLAMMAEVLLHVRHCLLEFHPGDFPGSSVVKTSQLQCRAFGLDPWLGNKIPHAMKHGQKIVKNKLKTEPPPCWDKGLCGLEGEGSHSRAWGWGEGVGQEDSMRGDQGGLSGTQPSTWDQGSWTPVPTTLLICRVVLLGWALPPCCSTSVLHFIKWENEFPLGGV